jgi:probable HAF family extracellular repeat protein
MKTLLVALILALLTANTAADEKRKEKVHSYAFQTLFVPGSTCTGASKLNDRGVIVGSYCDGGFLTRAFIYKKGEFILLDAPGAASTAALGINDWGVVVGQVVELVDNDFVGHSFLWDGEAFHPFDPPDSTGSAAFDINRRGHIVGRYTVADDTRVRGFLLINDVYTTISHPDSSDTFVSGINDRGEVVGNFTHVTTLRSHGFIWQDGTFVEIIDHPDTEFNTALWDINRAGSIVGESDVGGFVLLKDQFVPIAITGARFTQPLGINNRGQIVGAFEEGGVLKGFLAKPEKGKPVN